MSRRLAWTRVGDDVWVTYDERFSAKDKAGKLLFADNSMYRYQTSMRQLQDAGRSSVDMVSWSTETNWWDWMAMEDHPGHLIFGSMGRKYDGLDQLPKQSVAAAERYFPTHLSKPIDWTEYDLPAN